MEFDIRSKESKKKIIIRLFIRSVIVALLAITISLIVHMYIRENPYFDLKQLVFSAFFSSILSSLLFISGLNKDGFYNGKVKISKEGINLKVSKNTAFMSWNDVDYVSIERHMDFSKELTDFISFYYNEESKPKVSTELFNKSSKNYINEDCIFMEYCEDALSEIKKYYKDEISKEYYYGRRHKKLK